MTTEDEHLLEEIGRRNWIILGILILLSLALKSKEITLGVLAGGIVVISGYYWMHSSLSKLVKAAASGSEKTSSSTYVVRLAALALVLYILIAKAGVHPVGLVVGLSVVVINLFWTTLKRLF